MTKNARLKLVSRVRDARRRLRDAVAGDLAVAEAEHVAADERRSEAAADVDEVKATVVDRLTEARTVRTLWTFEHEHRVAVSQLSDAERAVKAALEESDRQRARLAARARELKTAEKVVDRTRTGIQHDERRAEQRSNDDLAGRTRRDD